MALLLALLGSGPAAAQTVAGSVLEQGSGAPVTGAVVQLRELGGPRQFGAATDARGTFMVRLAGRSGKYLLRVLHPAYQPLQDTLQLSGQEAITLRLQLGRDAIPIEPLVVTARVDRRLQGYRQRVKRDEGFARFVTRDQMDQLNAVRTSDYLRRVPGLTVDRVNGGGLVTLRNPLGECRPLLYLDGTAIEQRPGDDVDALVEPALLEGIEIYPGTVGMPAEFAAAHASGCGVVAFWTREPGGRPVTWTRVLLSAGAIGAFVLTAMKIML